MHIIRIVLALSTFTAMGFVSYAQIATPAITQPAPTLMQAQTPEMLSSTDEMPGSTEASPNAGSGSPQPEPDGYNPPKEDPLARAAALYATYHDEITDIQTNGFRSALDIDRSLKNLGGHNPGQLTQGWISYSALVAAQNPEFRAAVRDIESYYGRDVFISGLGRDVRYARSLNGGNAAMREALSTVHADSRRLLGAAAYVKEQAYTLQASGWAKGRLGNSSAIASSLLTSTQMGIPARADLVTALQSSDLKPVLSQLGAIRSGSVWENVSHAASAIRLPSALSRLAQGQPRSLATGREPMADQITTLAAYHILEAQPTRVNSMRLAIADPQTENCLNMANLNLQQCVAAAHKHYEVPFCIGEHALSDVGKCIGKLTH